MNYIGSKKTLKDWIFQIIDKYTKDCEVFCDLFAGSCEITKEAKKRNYTVISNDLQYYSYILSKYYLENNQEIDIPEICPVEGTITKLYSKQSKYFTEENAKICDGYLKYIKDNGENIPLLANLIMAMDCVANTASIYGAYLKKYKQSSLKKVSLKQEIINGKNGKAYCEPAEILINKISGDILYMDPPYNTRQYSSNYHVLETIARNDEPEVHGKTLLRNDCKKSLFSSKRFAKKALEEIIKNAKFKYIFMSYNNEGILSLEDIKKIFEKYGSYNLETKEYKKFNSGSGVLEKNTIEYLHILIK